MAFAPIYDQVRLVTLTTFTQTFGGEGSVEPAAGVYTFGEVITLTAAPTQTFQNWDGDWTGTDNPTVVPMDDDRAITAVFGFDPDTMEITIDPDGADLPNDGSTQQFTVTVTDGMSNTGDVTADATYSTTDPGGTVVGGLYTPGGTDGTFEVCVTYQGVQECVTVNVGDTGPVDVLLGRIELGNFMSFDNVSVTVRIYDVATVEAVAVVDAGGFFTLTTDDIPALTGDFKVCIKEPRAVPQCEDVVTLASVASTNFGPIVAGEAEGNNDVGFNDLLTLAALWGSPDYNFNVDFANDGVGGPDFNDLLVLAGNWLAVGDGWDP
jgi:hypothetical protein